MITKPMNDMSRNTPDPPAETVETLVKETPWSLFFVANTQKKTTGNLSSSVFFWLLYLCRFDDPSLFDDA